MNTAQEQELHKEFSKLLPATQQIIQRSAWKRTTRSIAKEEGLNSEQASLLELEVGFVLAQLAPPVTLFENIRSHVNLDEQKTIAVLNKIIGRIFEPIRILAEQLYTEEGSTLFERAADYELSQEQEPLTSSDSHPVPKKPSVLGTKLGDSHIAKEVASDYSSLPPRGDSSSHDPYREPFE